MEKVLTSAKAFAKPTNRNKSASGTSSSLNLNGGDVGDENDRRARLIDLDSDGEKDMVRIFLISWNNSLTPT